MLPIERILRLCDSLRIVIPKIFGRHRQCVYKVSVRHRRILNGNIMNRRTLIPHRSRIDNTIQCFIKGCVANSPCRSHPDKSIRAALDQFFQRNGGRRTAHTSRRNRHRDSVQFADPCFVLPIMCNQFRFIKVCSNQICAERVSRKQYIAPHVAFFQANVIHHTLFQFHNRHYLSFIDNIFHSTSKILAQLLFAA